MTPVKTQHYLFAAEAIPILFHNQPQQVIGYLNKDGVKFLKFWWKHVADKVEPALRSEPKGLGFQVRDLPKDRKIALITLPQPQHEGEPYFMALVTPPTGFMLPMFRIARVFCLEYRPAEEGEPGVCLVEWTPRILRHVLNLTPPPELEAFYNAVVPLIGKK